MCEVIQTKLNIDAKRGSGGETDKEEARSCVTRLDVAKLRTY